jgi:hypothetical protein
MELGSASPLINPVKFNSFQNISPEKHTSVIRSISLGFLNKKKNSI